MKTALKQMLVLGYLIYIVVVVILGLILIAPIGVIAWQLDKRLKD